MNESLTALGWGNVAGFLVPFAYLTIAGATVFRFRKTPTTYLIASAMVGLTIRALLYRPSPVDVSWPMTVLVVGLISQAALVVGIALIPLSLRRLSAKAPREPATF